MIERHQINAAFFYADASWIVSKELNLIKDDINISLAWSELAITQKLPCYVCIGSLQKRGIADANNSQEKLMPGFTIGSLVSFITFKQKSQKNLIF